MKIMTVMGTRPEIIRLSRIVEALDRLADRHVLVYTGQNFDPSLSDLFFEELGVRRPDHSLGVRGETMGEQIGQIITQCERVMLAERPDRLLVLGDTNSALSAIVAKRLAIPVYHIEAGNRCFDDRVPEEVNRRIIDHSSDVLMPYTGRSRDNLLREGFESRRVFVIGNPIGEVIEHYDPQIRGSNVLRDVGLSPRKYLLATMHRAENVDVEPRLRALVASLDALQREYDMPIVCSTHPRTRAMMDALHIDAKARDRILFHAPFGFFDFIALERNAFCVLSDSGTVQEECCLFKVPNVTIRDVTERPETIDCGSNMLGGADPETIRRCVRTVVSRKSEWTVPPEYLAAHVSRTAANILLGFAARPELDRS